MTGSDPRISTYLDDLARMLSDLHPDERDEVLAGVREHVDSVLAEHPDDPRAVDDALLRLGPPERVAAEARPDRPPTTPKPTRSVAWVRVAVILTLLTTAPFLLLSLLDRATWSLDRDGSWPATLPLLGPPVMEMSVLWPVWAAGLVANLVNGRLSSRTRVALASSGPLAFLAVAVSSFWQSPPDVSGVLSAALLLAALVAVVAASRRAWREGHAARHVGPPDREWAHADRVAPRVRARRTRPEPTGRADSLSVEPRRRGTGT